MNQTDAYLQAGYKVNRDQANKRAHALIKQNKTFAEALKKAQARAAKEAGLSQANILKEKWLIARSDPGLLFDPEQGTMLAPNQLPAEIRRCVKAFQVKKRSYQEKATKRFVTETTYKYWFWDKVRALELLAKYEGMYEGKGENSQAVYFVDGQTFNKPKTAGTSKNKIKADDPRTNGR